MDVTLYGLKTCDTCRKATRALEAAGHQVRVVDVRADGVSAEALSRWLAEHGAEVLVNTRSTTWKGLDDAARARAGTAEGAVALIREHPALMKRPVIVADGASHVGWTPGVRSALGIA